MNWKLHVSDDVNLYSSCKIHRKKILFTLHVCLTFTMYLRMNICILMKRLLSFFYTMYNMSCVYFRPSYWFRSRCLALPIYTGENVRKYANGVQIVYLFVFNYFKKNCGQIWTECTTRQLTASTTASQQTTLLNLQFDFNATVGMTFF